MNSVVLIGRLTRDPELRYSPGSQMAIAKFSIAIDRPQRQGREKETDFPRITVFGKQAENCEKYLTKGRLVGIQGRLQTGSYQDKDGKTVYTTDVIADRVEFLEWGDKKQGSGNYGSNSGGNYTPDQGYNQGGYGSDQGFNQGGFGLDPGYGGEAGFGGNQGDSFADSIDDDMPDSFQKIDENVPF